MTGQGQGRKQIGAVEIAAEVRAVNNRHLKVQLRTSVSLGNLETQIEALVRRRLRRGSLQLSVQLSGGEYASAYRLQPDVLANYYRQCQELSAGLGIASTVGLRDLLALPGVVAEPRASSQDSVSEELAACVLQTVADALDCLNRMRATEGLAMHAELKRQLYCITELSQTIEELAPSVIEEYQSRLCAKLSQALEGATPPDVIREVLIMADKADIREEIVRLRSHLVQFDQLLDDQDSQGRKLDFLIQEMFREVNTIGSKAGSAVIAQRVVDIKSSIEQMRELVQNAE